MLLQNHSLNTTLDIVEDASAPTSPQPPSSSPRDDLIRAIKKLKVLGNGFGILPVGGTYLIQSVPAELNMDHTVVIQLAEVFVLGEEKSAWSGSLLAVLGKCFLGQACLYNTFSGVFLLQVRQYRFPQGTTIL